MDKQIRDFKRIIELKKNLILKDEDTLLTQYYGKEKVTAFLEDVLLLVEKENAFLSLTPRFIEVIEDIIHFNFSFFKDKELNALKNEVVIKLNIEKSKSENEKVFLAGNYIDYQNEMRHLSFANSKQFLGAMSYDAEILNALENGRLDDFPLDDLFLATTNYFLEMIPVLYKDEEIKKATLERFELIKKKNILKNRMLKKFVKVTQKNFSERI